MANLLILLLSILLSSFPPLFAPLTVSRLESVDKSVDGWRYDNRAEAVSSKYPPFTHTHTNTHKERSRNSKGSEIRLSMLKMGGIFLQSKFIFFMYFYFLSIFNITDALVLSRNWCRKMHQGKGFRKKKEKKKKKGEEEVGRRKQQQ